MVEKELLCSSAATGLSCCCDAAVKKANAGGALGGISYSFGEVLMSLYTACEASSEVACIIL